MEQLTKQDAIIFFASLYGGEHHIPGYKVYEFGNGWMVKDHTSCWATFDFNTLTKFVLMCHDKCIRGEIRPHTFDRIKVIIHKRQGREGSMFTRHPDINEVIKPFIK